MDRDYFLMQRRAMAQAKRANSLPPSGDDEGERRAYVKHTRRAALRSARLHKQAMRLSCYSRED